MVTSINTCCLCWAAQVPATPPHGPARSWELCLAEVLLAMGGWRAKKERCVLDTHFEVTVAAAEPLTGTRDGFVLPLHLGTCLGKLEWCACPPGVTEAQEGTHGVSGTSPSASSPALSQQGKKLKELLFIWLFAALFCGEMRGLTQVHIKHYCHSRSFKMVNRWKKNLGEMVVC